MRTTSVLFAAALACIGSAQAATLLETTVPTGQIESPGSITQTFTAGAGPAMLSVQIAGYASLDGENCCTDVFHLSINNTEIFSGSFDLGGGGSNVVYTNTNGATATPTSFGFFGGGKLDIVVPFAAVAGTNTLTFSYSGSAQGLNDEAWGVNNVLVTGAVPEPETYALMVVGLAGLGFVARRRKSV